MFTLIFWQATLERAVKSFAQSLVAALGAGSAAGWDVPGWSYLSVAAMTALLSVLTSLSSMPIGPAGSPSLVARQA